MTSPNLAQFKQFVKANDFVPEPFFHDMQEIAFARAPGRLDVMGGIADYSGSLVLEMPIAEATLTAVQPNPEPIIQIISIGKGRPDAASQFSMPLADFFANGQPIRYETAVIYFQQSSNTSWAAYIAGAFLVLMREKGVMFKQGAKILIQSAVPEGKGVSSSAAVEVAAMLGIARAFNIDLNPIELATLCQTVENRIANAPCGIMDQMTVVNGRANQLMALLCQPATIQGYVDIPPQLAFWGIDSGIRHAVSGADYGSVRVGAFMGYKILQAVSQQTWGGYVANISPAQFGQHYRDKLPETLLGVDFLEQYGELPDGVTAVNPSQTYAVRQPTAHPIYEHFRVKTFARLLAGDAVQNAPLLGELMYQSHASYSACGLGSTGTDLLVGLVRTADKDSGLFGAKITGGGSGGTVVLLGLADAEPAVQEIAARYQAETGHRPYIFRGSSPGAMV